MNLRPLHPHVHHLWIWGALALSVLLLLISCPVRGADAPKGVAPPPPSNGVFRIAVMKRDVWVAAGEVAQGEIPGVREVVLRGLTIGDPIHVRITVAAPGAAQLDMVLLNGRAPIAARNALLRKLVAADFDVTNAHNRAIELTFVPSGETSATLTLLGRIEPKRAIMTPWAFPLHNQGRDMADGWTFYTYLLGARPGSLTLNGELDEEHLPNAPLFAERLPAPPGNARVAMSHPDGVTLGWALNDHKTLFVALDVTPDNTYDADRDAATLFAQVNGIWRGYKVDVSTRTWGHAGYTYTQHASYEHKVYEFAIPLGELGLANAPKGTPVKLAFAVSGVGSGQ